jgi:hypothetical protein
MRNEPLPGLFQAVMQLRLGIKPQNPVRFFDVGIIAQNFPRLDKSNIKPASADRFYRFQKASNRGFCPEAI